MDNVFVKVKKLRKQPIFKLVSDSSIYDSIILNDVDCVDYDPDHNLDEDSWFKIENFSNETFCLDLLKENFDVKDYDDLDKSRFVDITYIFSNQDNVFYFQKVTPSLFLKRKTIVFGESAEIENSKTRLVINSLPDAIYFPDEDTLIFRNLATISSIFKGIDQLYKKATKQEVKSFLKEKFIDLQNDYSEKKVSKPNRKRIALAMNSLKNMSSTDRNNIFKYIHKYCSTHLQIDKNKKTIQISNDNDLKLMLYGIEQRFFTTPIGKEKRLANSIQKL